MDARCEGLGRRREGVGRKERESQVKNDQRGRCVSVSGKRCIIIPILSPLLLLLLLLLLSSLFPPRLTVGLVIIPRDIFSHSCISLTSHQWPSTRECMPKTSADETFFCFLSFGRLHMHTSILRDQ